MIRTHPSFAMNLSLGLVQQNWFERKNTWLKWPAPIGPAVGQNQAEAVVLASVSHI